jgi:hypothetical protein
MRTLALGVLGLFVACDPAAIANFDVHPQPGRLNIDSSFVLEASRLGREFAQRHQLASRPRSDCPSGAYYADDTARGRPVGLNFCLTRIDKEFRFSVVEIITSKWGPKGAALRDELEDTLTARYGAAVRADITRR